MYKFRVWGRSSLQAELPTPQTIRYLVLFLGGPVLALRNSGLGFRVLAFGFRFTLLSFEGFPGAFLQGLKGFYPVVQGVYKRCSSGCIKALKMMKQLALASGSIRG